MLPVLQNSPTYESKTLNSPTFDPMIHHSNTLDSQNFNQSKFNKFGIYSKNFKLKFNNIFDEPVTDEVLKQFDNKKVEQERMIKI